MIAAIQREIQSYVDARFERLIELTQELVRRPSENRAPHGSELAAQEYVAAVLRSCGFTCDVYTPDEAPGITSHPLYWQGRDYRNRPNVAGLTEDLNAAADLSFYPVISTPFLSVRSRGHATRSAARSTVTGSMVAAPTI
jgi:acetylornithine deacetylase/succinyl-diaminopimelate desuccinylase-like protein